jgi:hypothetical protein
MAIMLPNVCRYQLPSASQLPDASVRGSGAVARSLRRIEFVPAHE